jgi:ABC-type molybdate transport system substrate-binding protein
MRTVMVAAMAWIAMSAQAQETIRLYAAGSLRSALNEIAAAYPVKVDAVYGPSGLLRERIVRGERPDIFASANIEHPHSLARQGLAGPVKRFARNRLCALAAPGVEVDSASLLERMLDPGLKLGMSTPKADPSGDYAMLLYERAEAVRPGARAALEKKALRLTGGVDSPPPPKDRNPYGALVGAGKADIFLTYCTNAQEAKNENAGLKVVRLPGELAVGAEYGIALVEGSREAAFYFTQFVLSPAGQTILAKHGFSPPGE